MDHSFWQSRWREQRIGFHRQDVNPKLVKYASHWLRPLLDAPDATSDAQLELDGARVLVPLCGKSVDLLWLAERGAQVVGVEFVEQAAQEFFQELGTVPRVEATTWGKRFSVVEAPGVEHGKGHLELWVADFFALTPEALGPIDAIYDRAAMVAVPPERRRPYVEQLKRLSRKEVTALVISFEHDGGDGPPFSVPPPEVRALFEPDFRGELLTDDDILGDEPRFRARGVAVLREQVWVFTRG